MEARASGPFKDLFDFCERVDSRRVNKKVVEALVKAGAFDFEKRPRRQLFETLGSATERGSSVQRDRAVGQSSLFGMLGGESQPVAVKNEYVPVEEWSEKERLSFEKEAIGFYVSGHPLHQYEKELKRYARSCATVQRSRREDKVVVAGIVSQLRERPTKTGKRMAWVTLEDLSGHVEVVCFPSKDGTRSVMGKDGRWSKAGPKPGFDQWESLLKSDEPLLVTGTVQFSNRDEEQPSAEIIAEEVQSLREVREKRVKRLEVKVEADLVTEDRLQRLAELAGKSSGQTPLAMSIRVPGQAEALIGATSYRVAVSDELITAVDKIFGAKVAELV
jgi:DNA polymerase-3 subunit alpha